MKTTTPQWQEILIVSSLLIYQYHFMTPYPNTYSPRHEPAVHLTQTKLTCSATLQRTKRVCTGCLVRHESLDPRIEPKHWWMNMKVFSGDFKWCPKVPKISSCQGRPAIKCNGTGWRLHFSQHKHGGYHKEALVRKGIGATDTGTIHYSPLVGSQHWN